MAEPLEAALKISIVVFMAGNLLAMGLVLKIPDVLKGLRDLRFVLLSLLLGFLVFPAVAWLIVQLVPMHASFGMGLLVLGMVPCAPFLPAMVERAGGDIGYTASFMLLMSLLTVLYMPLAVPLMVEGLETDAWTIARPLIVMVLIPFVVGMLIQNASAAYALRLHPLVKKTTGAVTLIMLVLCIVVYGEGFLEAVGSFAVAAQLLFYAAVILVSILFARGLQPEHRSVLSLGMCTRNLGAAFAPLYALGTIDERAIIMVALGVPLQVLAAFLLASGYRHRAACH